MDNLKTYEELFYKKSKWSNYLRGAERHGIPIQRSLKDNITEFYYQKVNKKWIDKIDQLLDLPRGDNRKSDIISFLKELVPHTKYPKYHKHLLDKLTEMPPFYYLPEDDMVDLLKNIKHILTKTKINNINIYAPNHGSPYWTASSFDMSFSG